MTTEKPKENRKILIELDYEWSEGVMEFLEYLKGWHRGTIHKIKLRKIYK